MQAHNWPWWVPCHTEKHHWVPHMEGNDAQGGQCDGLWWRHARDEWLQGTWARPDVPETLEKRKVALDAYEAPWISEYGEEAHEKALKCTQQAFLDSIEEGNTIESMWEASERRRKVIEEEQRQRREDRRGSGSEKPETKARGKKRGFRWGYTPW